MNDEIIKENYLSTTKICETLKETRSTIYWWCSAFGIESSHKSCGQLYFSRDNVAILHNIQNLLRVQNFTIKGAKQKLREAKLI